MPLLRWTLVLLAAFSASATIVRIAARAASASHRVSAARGTEA